MSKKNVLPAHSACAGSGQYGALGSGMTGLISNQPVQVSSNESFVQVCTGPHHSCALDGSGRAFCWGKFDMGSQQVLEGRHGRCSRAGLGRWAGCTLSRGGGAPCTRH